ncbi:MAG TPA: trigger factor [Pyrinomonadaceae bacterium]|nr:trigger factor [Pyrinomonadaceae bacterium]
MKTELIEISPTRKQIDVVIEPEAVRAVYDRISDKYAKGANVPGFRPGHAPRGVVRTRFKDQIRTELLRELLPDAVQKAVEEHKLAPLGEPELNLENTGGLSELGEKPISFSVNVEVLPDIKLGDYKGLEVARRTRPVKDEDLDRVIESLRENSATLEPVEDRGAQPGDTVTANFHGKFLNQPDAEPIKVEDVDVVLGGPGVVSEITDNLTGAKPDDEKVFTVDYPADFSSKGLAGKQVEYTIKVSSVRIKELPELDDEWAQSLGEEIESLGDLRAKVRSDLESQTKNEADNKVRADLVRQIVEAHQLELPERLVEHQTEVRLESVVRDMIGQGIDPRNKELNWDKARDSLKEQASYDLRGSLLLERIADEEKIEVSEQEIDDEINAIAEASRQSPEQVRGILTKQGGERSIAGRLRNRKALEFLVANAKITDQEWTEEIAESGTSSQEPE